MEKITVKELSQEYNMKPRKVRRLLRTNLVDKETDYYWMWDQDSKQLSRVKGILSRD